MKRLLFTMIVASTMIISFNSCSKDDTLPPPPPPPPPSNSTTINLTTDHWEAKGSGIFVDIFSNIIRPNAKSVNAYLISSGEEVQINERISFWGGMLWATNTQTDLVITYRGSLQTPPSLNIKVVME